MRTEMLCQKLREQNLDAILIADPANRRYLSGFTGSTATLLVTSDRQRKMMIVDFRYFERAERESPDWQQVRVTGTRQEALVAMVDQSGAKRLGIEADHMTVAEWQELQACLPAVELVATQKVVLSLRAVKDHHEIAAIKAAVACADAAFAHLCAHIRPGMTERQVAWELERHMRENGATSTSFPIIVGSGPNGAMPHATSSERQIQAGEPIVIDFGAVVDGYCSDITRTICLGEGDERYAEIWQLVLQAQRDAKAQIRAGITGREADAIARDVFVQAGCGEQFGHGLGHGVGLNIHEAPFMGRTSEDLLQPGMVVTVEPGLYLPGWGGVRIEDIVVLGHDGLETLTGAAKEPALPL